MFEVGRICYKIAGRDAGKLGVVVSKREGNFVMLEGEVRRRKCSISHIEPLDKMVKVKEGASFEEVKKALEKEGFKIGEKGKKKEKKEKPVSKRVLKSREKKEKPVKAKKAEVKKGDVKKAKAKGEKKAKEENKKKEEGEK